MKRWTLVVALALAAGCPKKEAKGGAPSPTPDFPMDRDSSRTA